MARTEEQIAELHEFFCARSGVHTKLCFSQRLWYDLAKIYGFDFRRLRDDVDLLVRYLKREIARDKRNLGALKLSNLLQPDQFDEDLALARLAMATKQGRHGRRPSNPLPGGTGAVPSSPRSDPGNGWRGDAAKAKIRELRDSLRGKA